MPTVRLARSALLVAALAVGVLPCLSQAAAQTPVYEPFPPGVQPASVAVNPVTNRIYVANYASNDVTVLDAANNATATIPVGAGPRHVAVNPATNKIYVSNVRAGTVSVIDGATHAVALVSTGDSGPIAIDQARNRAYVIRGGLADEVSVIHGETNRSYAMAIYSYQPVALALNPYTGKLYVASYTTGDVRAVDVSFETEYPATTAVGVWSKPVAVAVNPVTNKIYVISEDERGPIGIIDGPTHTATFLNPPGHARGPRAIAVNTATNKIYAAFAGEVIVIDGATHAMTFVPSGTPGAAGPLAVAVNEQTNKIYVPNVQGFVTVIDGATNTATHVPAAGKPAAVAINPNTNMVYVASPGLTVMNGASGTSEAPPPAINVQGLWWQPSESGWGINLTHQGDIVVATWFTYDTDGQGMWLIMSNGARVGTNTYSGTLYRTTGPAFNSAFFDPGKVVHTPVGNATFTFSDANNGGVAAIVNGASISKSLTRMVFASPVPTCTAGGGAGAMINYQDLWWRAPAGSESGWGVNLTHQGDVIFATWFTYGADGKGQWLSASAQRTGNATYAGTLYRSWGPPYNKLPWSAASVTRMPVGNITFTFSDTRAGDMAYTLEGASQSKPITRMVYSSPATVCR
jgi:YVTN family beta-propeller protein